MNENLNLVEILKDCPKGFKLYSSLYGEVEFKEISDNYTYPIVVLYKGQSTTFTKEGKFSVITNGECVLFPSREQRDWGKFKHKQTKFDPKTLQPFDRVLVRLTKDYIWNVAFFSHYNKEIKCGCFPFVTTTSNTTYGNCIPYNDETKHLLGTSDEAPEYYRYWED